MNKKINVGFQAKFACNPGFILTGNSTIYCQQKQNPFDCQGKWSENAPTCKPRDCEKPNLADNKIMTIVGDKFYFPEVIQFRCVKGYNLQSGGARWRCSLDGIWIDTENRNNTEYPICKPVSCGQLPNLENGRVEGQNFDFPAEVKFSCNRGYCIEGSVTSNCQTSGKWSSEPPRCNRVKCKKPSKPKFGQILVNTTDIFVDFIATYQCNNGYDINGKGSLHKYERICLQNKTINHCDGKWSNIQPVCKPKRCPTVRKQNNRTILGKLYEYPHSITIGCDDGHELRGGSSVWNCSDRGTWIDTITKTSGDLPSCEPRDCNKPNVSENCGLNGTYYKYPGVVNFTRLHGYCVDGATSITCKSDGKWSSQSPSCKRITCQKISRPRNGSISRNTFGHRNNPFVNSTVAFSCDEGYDLNGNANLSILNVSCLQQDDILDCNGRWNNTTPCCIPRSCTNPSTSNFMNGTIIGDAFFFPESINLTCNKGYELIGGTPIFKCNEKGNWVEVKTPQQENKNVVQVRIERQRKYFKKCTGNQVLVPKTNEVTNPHFPTCKPKNCHMPKENSHCKRVGIYFQYPGIVEYDRDYGYCIVGPNITQCNSSGQWSNKVPNCKQIECPPLSDPEHGTVQLSSEQRFVDDTAVYSCHSGYDLNMDKNIPTFTRTCLQPDNPHECKGAWSKTPPCCIPRSCPDPKNSNFRNGSIRGNAYFYPETISLNCKEGHELVGVGSYFQCNQSGQWHEISKTSDEALQQATDRINSELENLKACISPKSNTIKTRHFSTKLRQFPTCQPKYCRKPVVDSNCTLVSRSFHYPNQVMFDRKYGYCVVGSNISQCNSQGLWSKASPTCEHVPVHSYQPTYHREPRSLNITLRLSLVVLLDPRRNSIFEFPRLIEIAGYCYWQ
ncbi:sushi, von Willebrand factor type A, EGF and pentraxin domain-containing protein 1-like [Corticium candelabrum]|uniref:sushi, von Willebrand factor type A, EGF and pentraxin domain-containing protein 1-like n=1 Tax=Corticium candelabrum TaxID=121492 RepID=UPI002E26AD9E|nr:sushi, von Willebrand factor type A, EGF and pentraxin domain-containing protein 1-like [Corticium candelabrum]